jgi:hypothetical protein
MPGGRMRHAALLAAVLFISASDQAFAKERTPLYDLFQSLCVDTKANPELIRKAIKVADFQPHERLMPTSGTPPMQLSGTDWDFEIGARKFSLTAIHGIHPYGHAMLVNSDACSVVSWGEDKASLVALNEWLGGKGDPGAFARLDFTFDGSMLVRLTDDASVSAAMKTGSSWTATITNFGSGGTAMLDHLGVPYPRP